MTLLVCIFQTFVVSEWAEGTNPIFLYNFLNFNVFFSQQLLGTQFLTIWVNCIVSKWDDLKTSIYNIRKLSLLSHFGRDITGESEVLPKLDKVFAYMIIILSSLS